MSMNKTCRQRRKEKRWRGEKGTWSFFLFWRSKWYKGCIHKEQCVQEGESQKTWYISLSQGPSIISFKQNTHKMVEGCRLINVLNKKLISNTWFSCKIFVDVFGCLGVFTFTFWVFGAMSLHNRQEDNNQDLPPGDLDMAHQLQWLATLPWFCL